MRIERTGKTWVFTGFGLIALMGVVSFGSLRLHDRSFVNRALGSTNDNSKPATFLPVPNDHYLQKVQPILSHRCVVCHACAEAPCQLLLTSFEAITRGATDHGMLDFGVTEHDPTRLKDAKSLSEWRDKGFFSVLGDPEKANADSTLLRLIERGLQRNQPGFSLSAIESHRKSGNRCPSNPEQYSSLVEKFPDIAMPYGLPALSDPEFGTLETWVLSGARGPSREAIRQLQASSNPRQVESFESFFNRQGTKSQLVSRYVFEHTYTSHIHFAGTPADEFYQLIRSRTPSPEVPEEIVTERIYDSPGNGRFLYRLKRVTEVIVQKTHLVWEIDAKTLPRLNELFYASNWGNESSLADPGYDSQNPFEYFSQIPAKLRYRFMLENSLLMVNAMVRGPVCSGRTATYAIRDQFWIFFIDPEQDVSVLDPSLGLENYESLGSRSWTKDLQYKNAYEKAMRRLKPKGFSVQDIWDGDGSNPNAALTVLRHERSATVHYGLIGGYPETIWTMNYTNFERIYYNLVVDYAPWGSIGHNLATWRFMSRLRSEAEERFLTFIPKPERDEVRSEWNRGIGNLWTIVPSLRSSGRSADTHVDPKDPVYSLVRQMIAHVPPGSLGHDDPLSVYDATRPEVPARITNRQELETALAALSGRDDVVYPQYLPNITLLMIDGQPWVYSLITHRGYAFNTFATMESLAREKEKDRLAAFPGIVGDRPELFIRIDLEEARAMIDALMSIRDNSQWIAFKNRYTIRRNSEKFWPTLDLIQEWNRSRNPSGAGILDVSNYDVTDETY